MRIATSNSPGSDQDTSFEGMTQRAKHMTRRAARQVEAMRTELQQQGAEFGRHVRRGMRAARGSMRRHPAVTVGVALGVVALLGALWYWRRR